MRGIDIPVPIAPEAVALQKTPPQRGCRKRKASQEPKRPESTESTANEKPPTRHHPDHSRPSEATRTAPTSVPGQLSRRPVCRFLRFPGDQDRLRCATKRWDSRTSRQPVNNWPPPPCCVQQLADAEHWKNGITERELLRYLGVLERFESIPTNEIARRPGVA